MEYVNFNCPDCPKTCTCQECYRCRSDKTLLSGLEKSLYALTQRVSGLENAFMNMACSGNKVDLIPPIASQETDEKNASIKKFIKEDKI